ncbi:MAG: MOSC domain-containing protein [Lewinellaceae bacterium]|nr:MOSC domain-containing protein [Lewinellaceae bacterium]
MDYNQLKNRLPQTGKLDWIGLRPGRREPVVPAEEATVDLDEGLIGDHYSKKGGDRQVTLIQAEHLQGVAGMLHREHVDPSLTRRNLLISGLNLLALQDARFRIGDSVILETTGQCHPCSRMEENLGPGGYQAMRGHGGLTARVVQGGIIRLGDEVRLLEWVQ